VTHPSPLDIRPAAEVLLSRRETARLPPTGLWALAPCRGCLPGRGYPVETDMGTMTYDEARALGERATACKGWRWLQGTLTVEDYVVVGFWYGEDEPMLMSSGGEFWRDTTTDHAPDLRDPCTVGGLLALVREAWGSSMVWAMADNTGCGWWVESWDADVPALIYATEAEALVAALEGAP